MLGYPPEKLEPGFEFAKQLEPLRTQAQPAAQACSELHLQNPVVNATTTPPNKFQNRNQARRVCCPSLLESLFHIIHLA